jgi:hypothetical protein
VTPAELVGLLVGLGALIAMAGKGLKALLKAFHHEHVAPAVASLTNAIAHNTEVTVSHTSALAKSEAAARETQSENREAFDGIHELVSDLRKEQHKAAETLSAHGARLDGHDVELRDLKHPPHSPVAMRAKRKAP